MNLEDMGQFLVLLCRVRMNLGFTGTSLYIRSVNMYLVPSMSGSTKPNEVTRMN